jgi:hypothetical protein
MVSNAMRRWVPAVLLSAIVVTPPTATAAPAADPTTGWTQLSWNADSYYVQNRTDADMADRFWISGGVYTTQVYAGEQRVEMRWDNWPNQSKEYMWDADVMIDRGTSKTCIMQIKSNEDGEPIYIQVANTNGDLRNDGDSSPIATNMYGKWFNLKAAFNPRTGVGRVWIDNVLVKTRQYRTGTSGWYFKNGTYNNGIASGQKSVAHFRDFRFWRNDH